jgi:hypothetical protein
MGCLGSGSLFNPRAVLLADGCSMADAFFCFGLMAVPDFVL